MWFQVTHANAFPLNRFKADESPVVAFVVGFRKSTCSFCILFPISFSFVSAFARFAFISVVSILFVLQMRPLIRPWIGINFGVRVTEFSLWFYCNYCYFFEYSNCIAWFVCLFVFLFLSFWCHRFFYLSFHRVFSRFIVCFSDSNRKKAHENIRIFTLEAIELCSWRDKWIETMELCDTFSEWKFARYFLFSFFVAVVLVCRRCANVAISVNAQDFNDD